MEKMVDELQIGSLKGGFFWHASQAVVCPHFFLDSVPIKASNKRAVSQVHVYIVLHKVTNLFMDGRIICPTSSLRTALLIVFTSTFCASESIFFLEFTLRYLVSFHRLIYENPYIFAWMCFFLFSLAFFHFLWSEFSTVPFASGNLLSHIPDSYSHQTWNSDSGEFPTQFKVSYSDTVEREFLIMGRILHGLNIINGAFPTNHCLGRR